MSETNRYIDRVRELTEKRTDYAVAKLLGVSESSINQYRKGTRTIDDEVALKVARTLKIEVAEIIAARNIDRAKTDEQRREWRKELKHYASGATRVLICAAVALNGETGGVTYPQVQIDNSDCGITATKRINRSTNYTQWERRSLCRAVVRIIQRLLMGGRSLRSRPPTPATAAS